MRSPATRWRYGPVLCPNGAKFEQGSFVGSLVVDSLLEPNMFRIQQNLARLGNLMSDARNTKERAMNLD